MVTMIPPPMYMALSPELMVAVLCLKHDRCHRA